MHNLFVQISANYGFGQDQNTLPFEDGVTAKKWELVGQTFIIVGMGLSKMSLALFLLRVVVSRWHRRTIWAVGGSLCFASCLTSILCWLQVRLTRSDTEDAESGADACVVFAASQNIRPKGGRALHNIPCAVGVFTWKYG